MNKNLWFSVLLAAAALFWCLLNQLNLQTISRYYVRKADLNAQVDSILDANFWMLRRRVCDFDIMQAQTIYHSYILATELPLYRAGLDRYRRHWERKTLAWETRKIE